MTTNEPVLPHQPPTRKPIASLRVMVLAFAAFFALMALIQLNRTSANNGPAQAQKGDRPLAGNRDQVNSFQKQQIEDAKRIQRDTAAAKEKLESINTALAAYGQPGEAAGVPPPTDQQRRMMALGESGPPSAGQRSPQDNPEKTARQKAIDDRVAQRKAAQESSTLAVDFSESLGKEVAINPTVVAKLAATADLQNAPPVTEDHAEPEAKPEGRTFKVLEGTLFECVLTNRLTGSFAGPVNVMLTTPVYSHDHNTLLLPQGTRFLGTVARAGGQDERLFVAFHRAILPTGYSVNLDQFMGLAQQGQAGLKDQVNRHYFQIFGASIALSAIESLAQAGANSTGSASVRLQSGIGQGTSSGASRIIESMLNRIPIFTVRERTRVKVYLSKDLTLSAYDAGFKLDSIGGSHGL